MSAAASLSVSRDFVLPVDPAGLLGLHPFSPSRLVLPLTTQVSPTDRFAPTNGNNAIFRFWYDNMDEHHNRENLVCEVTALRAFLSEASCSILSDYMSRRNSHRLQQMTPRVLMSPTDSVHMATDVGASSGASDPHELDPKQEARWIPRFRPSTNP